MATVPSKDDFDTKDVSRSKDNSEDGSPAPPEYQEGLSSTIYKDWTDGEEKKLLFKLDSIIMVILTLGFFCMQMDRGNIGNALTNNFLEDIGINRSHYNIGQQLLYAGIVALELPSNLILYRVGPRIWIGTQIIAWGLVELFQFGISNRGGFYATRLLLGMMEAGFIPAGLYTLSLWYKRKETSKRFTIFYFGNLVAQGATSLLAYGIFRMDGISGLHGWQWMFILEGLFTILVGFIALALLPKDTTDPYPLIRRISYFTAREREIMWKRVILDDPSKEKKSHHVEWKVIKKAFLTPWVYPHLLISMCGIACVATWLSYAPQIVREYGYSPLRSNALVSIGGWGQIPVSLALGIFADKFKLRGISLLIGVALVWGFVIGDLIVHAYESTTTKYAILIMTLCFSSTWQPINGSWLSINARSPAERSVLFAMFISSTNIGGIWGSQLFQPEDQARGYKHGWSAMVGLWSFALFLTISLNVMYRWMNYRKRHLADRGEEIQNGERVKFWL